MRRSRWIMSSFSAALLLAALASGAQAQQTDLWLLVEVDEARGAQVRVNLPLQLVKQVMAAIPKEKLETQTRLALEDKEFGVEQLRAIWAELERSPDATYVTVEDDGSHLRVAKQGRNLVIEVTDRGDTEATVNVRAPLAVVEGLLSGDEPHLDVEAAIQALIDLGEGELVTVSDGDSRVRIRIGRQGA